MPFIRSVHAQRLRLSCLLLSVMKEVRPHGGMPLKNTARNLKKVFRFLFGFPKRKNPTVVANRQSLSLAAKNSRARPI